MLDDALRHPGKYPYAKQAAAYMTGLAGRDLAGSGELTTPIASGRALNRSDVGTNHVVVNGMLADTLGINVGNSISYMIENRLHAFKVVGVESTTSFAFDLGGAVADNTYLRRIGALTSKDVENYSTTYLRIEDGAIQQDLAQLRQALPDAQILDLGLVTGILGKWIDRFALFPEIIAALSLFAGAVIIANSVALGMFERRREIAIMKAVGAKRRLVLRQLLSENAVLGFVGAVIGTGLAMIATAIVDQQVLRISASFEWLVVAGLLALGTALAMGAALITAWPASGEKPLTVLRYE
jgi:putative ABC transport system permease protein